MGQARSSLEQARNRASSSLGESKGQFADQFGTIAEALHLHVSDVHVLQGHDGEDTNVRLTMRPHLRPHLRRT